MICELTEAFKEMTVAYHLTNKVLIIEKSNSDLERKVEQLSYLGEQTKTKDEDEDSLEAPRSSPHISTKCVSSCEITSFCVEQTVLHPGYFNSIHYEKHTSGTVNLKAIEDKLAETERNFQCLQEQVNSSNAKVYKDQVMQSVRRSTCCLQDTCFRIRVTLNVYLFY